MEHLDKIMRRIQKLIERADHPGTPDGEADSCRAKAESLMREYRIAEEQLIAVEQTALTPVLREFEVINGMGNEFEHSYVDMAYSTAIHCGLRVHFSYRNLKGAWGNVWAHVVGYESDIRFAQYLYAAARLVFSTKLEPQLDRSLSDAENVFIMRQAGMERYRIAELLWGHYTHSNSAKVGRLYKAECLKRGIDPVVSGRQVNARTYRQAYAREFSNEFQFRLSRARDAADSYGGALTLHGRKERIDEAFYACYPQYQPKQASEQDNGSEKGKRVRRKSWTKADEARYQKLYGSAAARAGSAAGKGAAQEVVLTRSPARKDRIQQEQEQGTIALDA